MKLLALLMVSVLASAAGCAAPEAATSDIGTADDAEQEVRTCAPPATSAADPAAAIALWARVPRPWRTFLGAERTKDYFPPLAAFVADARTKPAAVFPAEDETFTALELAAPSDVQVVILGQDPYFNPDQAHGLAFSVKAPTAPPPSLQNIFKELRTDLPDTKPVTHGSLVAWAKQGVLLLNAVLTVEEGKPASHACHGWERFTDAIIETLSARHDKLVFVLWGSYAQSKIPLIDARHVIITGSHPSPLAARHGFFGTRPFSKVNAALLAQHKPAIDWQLPATP